MNEQEQLSEAIKISALAHAGQFDKGGKPYILHPLHLMSQLLFDPQLAAIAVLHDVIEDSATTLQDLTDFGMSGRIISAVSLLTHDSRDSYEEYINKICGNIDAVRVKRKDLQHNSDITRIKGVSRKDFDRLEKYHNAFVKLTEAKRVWEM